MKRLTEEQVYNLVKDCNEDLNDFALKNGLKHISDGFIHYIDFEYDIANDCGEIWWDEVNMLFDFNDVKEIITERIAKKRFENNLCQDEFSNYEGSIFI